MAMVDFRCCAEQSRKEFRVAVSAVRGAGKTDSLDVAAYSWQLREYLDALSDTPGPGELTTRTLGPRDQVTSGEADVAKVVQALEAAALMGATPPVSWRALLRCAASGLTGGWGGEPTAPMFVAADDPSAQGSPFPFVSPDYADRLISAGRQPLLLVDGPRGCDPAGVAVAAELRTRWSGVPVVAGCDRAAALALRPEGFRALPLKMTAVAGMARFIEGVGENPVTVGEFARFIEDGGYEDERWWAEFPHAHGPWKEPHDWKKQVGSPTHPVTGVSWYEATAYANYRSRVEGPVQVVSFAQRREVCGEPFPWGAEAATPSRLNFDQYVGGASPVGTYRLGLGPSGHADLGGNVWEWCSDLPDDESAVVCGGGWYTAAEYVRSDYLYRFHRSNRFDDLGFRLAQAKD